MSETNTPLEQAIETLWRQLISRGATYDDFRIIIKPLITAAKEEEAVRLAPLAEETDEEFDARMHRGLLEDL